MQLSEGDRIKVFENTDTHTLIHFIRTQGYRAELHGDYVVITGRYKYTKKMNKEQTGEWIKLRRREKKMTREKFAKACGVSVKTVWDWELGIKYPNDIWRIRDILDT